MDKKFSEVEILLVEDSMNDAHLIIRALRKTNLANNLVHVKDGVEALEFLFATGEFEERKLNDIPKLILLDIKMPRIDGIEVLKQIKSDNNTKSIPVVIMTSSNEEQDIIKSYKLGANSFIVKPGNFADFAKVVTELGVYWLILNQPPVY